MNPSPRLVLLLLTWLSCGFVLPGQVRADVARYALFVGNDLGDSDEPRLRYAERDAERVREVLREIGGFLPEHTTLLQGEDADTVRRNLISINARIRQRMADAGGEVLFVFFYSGHADAEALHLAGTQLPLRELTNLISGSPATFRVGVFDACRSGSATRDKGATVVSPLELQVEERLPGQGLAFLTASSADENAQESDRIGASFFTSALVGGLLGAADEDGDGRVVLDEAYRYAYQATLRETSRTLAGAQHPSYRYDFHGQGDLVLTRPGLHDASRARLQLPDRGGVLVMRGDEHGTVVAELSPGGARSISLPAGRYFVRVRGADVMHEGALTLAAGTTTPVRLSELRAIQYAHLVRKGGGARRSAHAVILGPVLRSPVDNARSVCAGMAVGYHLDFAEFGLRLRALGCQAWTARRAYDASVWELGLGAAAVRAWDLGDYGVEVGLGAGAVYVHQRLDAVVPVRTRHAMSPFAAIVAGAHREVGHGWFVSLDAALRSYVLPLQEGEGQPAERRVDLALVAALLAGRRF